MEYVKFGLIGLDVLKLVLGCMMFGELLCGMYLWMLLEVESWLII